MASIKIMTERGMFVGGLTEGNQELKPLAYKVLRDCITYHRYCEYQCNGCTREKLPFESWEDYDKAREEQMAWVEKRIDLVEKRLRKNADALGFRAELEGDPRGVTAWFVAKNNPGRVVSAYPWCWR